ncbi:hypothetical protein OCF84_21730 (plasmid) [Shewanella xiamenensis]|uniref:Uncharacterized protein n=1 Tax=Shewanella xiamenensis TaxID=332186 RepID=A0ABT6UDG2_9GAMM|nr:hypothetical protein [Shewanella xiamenensis]MDI5832500.1 hypothetical protein [Shewanella xiamenensis]WHF57881.1 hypothetical protein OCF84_21730 [Shewanella xiamenensis]
METPTDKMTIAEQALCAATTKFQSRQKIATNKLQQLLIISFFNLDFMPVVKRLLCPIFGEFEIYGHYLVKSVGYDEDLARAIKSDLESVIYSAETHIIEQPFKPDWLDDYLLIGELGINHVSLKTSLPELKSREPMAGQADQVDWDTYTIASLKADIVDLITRNVRFDDEMAVKEKIESVFSELANDLDGRHALENLHHIELVMPITRKSEYHQLDGLSDIDAAANIREESRAYREAELFLNKNRITYSVINASVGDKIRGLISSDSVETIKLPPADIFDDLHEGFELTQCVVMSICRYCQIVSMSKMKKMLLEISQELDVRSFKLEYLKLIKLSYPF